MSVMSATHSRTDIAGNCHHYVRPHSLARKERTSVKMSVECIFCITRIFIESDKSAVVQRLCSSDAATLGGGGERKKAKSYSPVREFLRAN